MKILIALFFVFLLDENRNIDGLRSDQSPWQITYQALRANSILGSDRNTTNESVSACLNCTADISLNVTSDSVIPIPPCSITDPECSKCTRTNASKSNVSLGRCVLFGATYIQPANGPAVGGFLVTIYGGYFGDDRTEKVGNLNSKQKIINCLFGNSNFR